MSRLKTLHSIKAALIERLDQARRDGEDVQEIRTWRRLVVRVDNEITKAHGGEAGRECPET